MIETVAVSFPSDIPIAWSDAANSWSTVLVDRPILLRDVLAQTLRRDSRFNLLAEVDDESAARETCADLRPHLVVMDSCLAQGDGMELARFLVGHLKETRVVVLSDSQDPFTMNRLAQIGVHGFVPKDQPWEILEEALIEIASGGTYFTAMFSQNQRKWESDPPMFAKILSAREQDILCHVASGQPSRSIAARLKLSPRSVETYRYRIMRKLGIHNLAGLIDYALRNGLAKT